MPLGQTFSTAILTTSLLILAVSANLRNHILHVNHVDATNADANPNDESHDVAHAADQIGKVGGIANAANSLVNNLASALKPNNDNFTEYTRPALIQEFIMAHNEIRREENMKPLVWNDTMAQLAEDWAKKQDHDCGMRHSSYQGMGENLFWGYKAHWLPREAVYDWAHEKQYYNKGNRECEPDKACDHYTQIIWKDTEQVGCARYKCSSGGLLVVCEYYPPGNWVGMDPYNPIPLSQLAHYNLSTTLPPSPSSSDSHTSPPSSPPPSSPPPVPPRFGEVSVSSSNTFLKRKGNKGAGHHVPRGQNGQSQGHHVPPQGNHGQGQGPHHGGHHRQPQSQSSSQGHHGTRHGHRRTRHHGQGQGTRRRGHRRQSQPQTQSPQGHHVPRQGNHDPINHGQGQVPRRGGHHHQPEPQSPPLVEKSDPILGLAKTHDRHHLHSDRLRLHVLDVVVAYLFIRAAETLILWSDFGTPLWSLGPKAEHFAIVSELVGGVECSRLKEEC